MATPPKNTTTANRKKLAGQVSGKTGKKKVAKKSATKKSVAKKAIGKKALALTGNAKIHAMRNDLEHTIATFKRSGMTTLTHYLSCGKQLVEMKKVLPHGGWEGFCDDINLGVRTASNMMRLYSENFTPEMILAYGGAEKALVFLRNRDNKQQEQRLGITIGRGSGSNGDPQTPKHSADHDQGAGSNPSWRPPGQSRMPPIGAPSGTDPVEPDAKDATINPDHEAFLKMVQQFTAQMHKLEIQLDDDSAVHLDTFSMLVNEVISSLDVRIKRDAGGSNRLEAADVVCAAIAVITAYGGTTTADTPVTQVCYWKTRNLTPKDPLYVAFAAVAALYPYGTHR